MSVAAESSASAAITVQAAFSGGCERTGGCRLRGARVVRTRRSGRRTAFRSTHAAVHGYTTAFWWAAGIFFAGAILVALVLKPGVQQTSSRFVGFCVSIICFLPLFRVNA